MRGDNRQIQTAVLGGADSEEPLMLPLEAIELDAFCRRHDQDSFWCGLLLGGCGGQLTTKLYTDRVCHFAHHPGADGHCGHRGRGVASADHLYVKAAASAWLRAAGDPGGKVRFDFARWMELRSDRSSTSGSRHAGCACTWTRRSRRSGTRTTASPCWGCRYPWTGTS